MKTNFETLQSLSSYSINHLKDAGFIDFSMAQRIELIDALAAEYAVSFATDEDIKEQAIEEVEDKMGVDTLPEDITESEMYNHARKEIIKSFNGENIAGLYLVESLNKIAKRVTDFLLSSEFVEDVFGSDEEITAFLVQKIRLFSIKRG